MKTETVLSILHAQTKPIIMAELAVLCNVSERKLRNLIAEIRENGLSGEFVLVCGDEGFWLTKNTEEISRWLSRYLSYAFTMIHVARHTKKFLTEAEAKKIQLALEF